MSKFIELHPLGDGSPMMVNLDEVKWMGQTEKGNALIKFVSYKEKDTLSLSVYNESYEEVKRMMEME